MKNVLFVSLGCDKNLVDSEKMLGLLNEAGYRVAQEESEADAIVVNTCCFIHDAKEESVETILEMAEWKKKGRLKALIVTGCMAQRYQDEIQQEIPEVDAVIGTTGYTEIISTLFPQIETGTLLPCWIVGCALFLAVSLLNIILIHRKIASIWKGKQTYRY